MPYLIDGHNLIGKHPYLGLDDLEDEKALVEILNQYCVSKQKKADVYFDKASPGHARAHVVGRVTARFVRSSETADTAIARRLKTLGKEAANWIVVSSDHEVQNAAKRSRARVLSSEDFVGELLNSNVENQGEDVQISKNEVDEWMKLFGEE